MYVVKGVCMQPQSIRLVAVEPTPPESSGPADVSFEIENVGENDRHCVVAVAGLPAAWYALEPHDISLAPGTRAPLRLTVRHPGRRWAATRSRYRRGRMMSKSPRRSVSRSS